MGAVCRCVRTDRRIAGLCQPKGLSAARVRSYYVSSMRWVDLFVIDTFLASGQRVPDGDQRAQGADEDDLPLADGTEPIERFDDRFGDLGDDDDDGDEWDAETLDEIPEDLEIPAADAFGHDAAMPPAFLRRLV